MFKFLKKNNEITIIEIFFIAVFKLVITELLVICFYFCISEVDTASEATRQRRSRGNHKGTIFRNTCSFLAICANCMLFQVVPMNLRELPVNLDALLQEVSAVIVLTPITRGEHSHQLSGRITRKVSKDHLIRVLDLVV